MGPPSRYAVRLNQQNDGTFRPRRHVERETTQTVVEWSKDHLHSLVTASSMEEFNNRASTFFARNVNITVNGLHLSRTLYAQQWGTRGSIRFGGAIETSHVRLPTVESASLVGIQFVASFYSAANDNSSTRDIISVSSSINLIIADDKSLPAETRDRRRVISINQILVDNSGAITFPLRN